VTSVIIDVMDVRKIKKINPRTIWQSESRDLTPWIAKNIDHLNDVTGLNVTVEQTEANVGPYKVDIYGEDANYGKVIIENQLEKTDHSHLGQILTYLVDLEANVTIWVATHPNEEHRKVIEWLNETTPDDMIFYLVKIEAITFEGQEYTVAPLFTVVEAPSLTMKKLGTEKKDFARRHTIRKEYWTQLIDQLSINNAFMKNISPSTDAWIGASLGVSGINLNLVATKQYVRAEIYINKGEITKNKAAFDILYADKDEIEKSFGGRLEWERMDDRVTSRIKCQLDDVNIFEEGFWPKMNAFLEDIAPRMHATFKQYAVKTKSIR